MQTTTFIKLSPTGEELPADATTWAAVRYVELGIEVSTHTLNTSPVNHYEAEKLCAELDLLGKKDWRLPTRKELCCLVDDTRISPAIDTNFFPDTRSRWYWSSSLYAGDSGSAWFVDFCNGLAGYDTRGYSSGFVRAVRSVGASSSGQ